MIVRLAAVPKIHGTWKYPIVKAWKKVFGCGHNHLFFVNDYFAEDVENEEPVYLYSDFRCEVCGQTHGGPK